MGPRPWPTGRPWRPWLGVGGHRSRIESTMAFRPQAHKPMQGDRGRGAHDLRRNIRDLRGARRRQHLEDLDRCPSGDCRYREPRSPSCEPAFAPAGSPNSGEQETHRGGEIGEGVSAHANSVAPGGAATKLNQRVVAAQPAASSHNTRSSACSRAEPETSRNRTTNVKLVGAEADSCPGMASWRWSDTLLQQGGS